MKRIGFVYRPEVIRNSNLLLIPPSYTTVCPSCQTEVVEKDIIEKRGSIGCVKCLKI